MPTIKSSESELRLSFFDRIFEGRSGFVCIGIKNPKLSADTKNLGFTQKFFSWPNQHQQIEEHILRNQNNRDIYFCINLLNKPERKKENCVTQNILWADLDEVDPNSIDPIPPIIMQSSPGRFQAIWRLSVDVDPVVAESYSKRIAYKYNADKSGWDLTQLLRVPMTYNHKYSPPAMVKLERFLDEAVPPLLFEMLPSTGDENEIKYTDLPVSAKLPTADQIIYKYTMQIKGTAFSSLYFQEISPQEDWSKPLWRLIHTCFEIGMSEDECFVVVVNSNLNKYARDHRPSTHLWRDILKARSKQDNINQITANFQPVVMPFLVDPDRQLRPSYVTAYREWAEEATDAVADFHDLSAFMLLSAIVANSVVLTTSYGPQVPNLWGMILGDSTLTRKTTAMRMVMDILNSLNTDMILATDGSAEGILSGLELRPNRTSVFFRDELSGFFDAINRKDYLAGMPETFTHLYDVPTVYTRRLRREVIRLESPVFIFFGGGVRDKVYEVTTEEYVTSGFLPRFVVVSGDAILGNLRRTGPANDLGTEKRARLVSWAADLYEHYAQDVRIKIGGMPIDLPPRVAAFLTPEAWEAYGKIEETLLDSASNSSIPGMALPTFERLSRSILKMAVILGAARQRPKDDAITIDETDVLDAAWYGQRWGIFSIDLIVNTGKGRTERTLDKIVESVKKHPGILRSTIMQHNHLTKKQADEILNTLEERMLIQKEKAGRGYRFWAI